MANDQWENISKKNSYAVSIIQRDRPELWERITDNSNGTRIGGFTLNDNYQLFIPSTGQSWQLPIHSKEDKKWYVEDGWSSGSNGRTVLVYQWEEMPVHCPILNHFITHMERSLTVYTVPGLECANLPINFQKSFYRSVIIEGSTYNQILGCILSPDGKYLAIHIGSKDDYKGEIRIYTW